MKRRDKEKEQSVKKVDDHSTQQKGRDEFKIEIIKVGRLEKNTQEPYDDMMFPPESTPPPS